MNKAWNSTLSPRRSKPRRVRKDAPKGEGAAILHPGPFRSEELRKLAAKAPHCMLCGARNTGNVVACHSNSLRDGKGMGQKAHDVVAFLCGECHDQIDGRTGRLTEFEKRVRFLEGVNDTMAWLFQSGHLLVIVEVAA